MLRRVVLLLVPVAVLAVLSPVPGRAATPLSFSPNAAFTDTPTSVTLTSSAAFSGTTGSVLLTPTAPATGPSYTVPLTAAGTTGTRWDAAVQLADPVTGTPAAPGLYDAVVTVGDEDQTCTACFTVLTRTEPRIHSCADVTPRRLQRGEDLPAVVVGSSFADGTVVEALEGKAASSHVVYSGPDTAAAGNDSGVLLSRSVHVEPDAPLGYYGVRVTNADGRTSTLERCLVVTASADKVEPTGVTNDMSRTLRLTVPDTLPKTATLRLFWVGPGAPAPQLDLPATGSTVVPANPSVPGDPSTITGTVNFVGATPSLNGYQAGYVLPDGSQHGCDGLCRFTVRQALPPVITGVKGLGTGSSLTRKVTLTGTGFTRGTTVQTDDPDVAVKSVAWTSTTSMTMTVLVAPTVDDTHPVTLTVDNPDGGSSSFTTGPARPPTSAPPVPATDDGTGDPDPSRAPAPPTVLLPSTSLAFQKPLLVTGTAEAGSSLDLFALTRPATTYARVRTLVVPDDEAWSFTVSPAGNTCYYAVSRNVFGRTRTEGDVCLVVRTQVTLTARRTAPRTVRLSGHVSPVRSGTTVDLSYLRAGKLVLLKRGVTVQPNGTWSFVRSFATTQRLVFVARSPATRVNAAGTSPRVKA